MSDVRGARAPRLPRRRHRRGRLSSRRRGRCQRFRAGPAPAGAPIQRCLSCQSSVQSPPHSSRHRGHHPSATITRSNTVVLPTQAQSRLAQSAPARLLARQSPRSSAVVVTKHVVSAATPSAAVHTAGMPTPAQLPAPRHLHAASTAVQRRRDHNSCNSAQLRRRRHPAPSPPPSGAIVVANPCAVTSLGSPASRTSAPSCPTTARDRYRHRAPSSLPPAAQSRAPLSHHRSRPLSRLAIPARRPLPHPSAVRQR
jgi:hypothetical protein